MLWVLITLEVTHSCTSNENTTYVFCGEIRKISILLVKKKRNQSGDNFSADKTEIYQGRYLYLNKP